MAFAMKLFKKNRQKYDKLNDLITLLMGKSDDLSLLQVMDEVEKTGMGMDDLLNDDKAIKAHF